MPLVLDLAEEYRVERASQVFGSGPGGWGVCLPGALWGLPRSEGGWRGGRGQGDQIVIEGCEWFPE